MLGGSAAFKGFFGRAFDEFVSRYPGASSEGSDFDGEAELDGSDDTLLSSEDCDAEGAGGLTCDSGSAQAARTSGAVR